MKYIKSNQLSKANVVEWRSIPNISVLIFLLVRRRFTGPRILKWLAPLEDSDVISIVRRQIRDFGG